MAVVLGYGGEVLKIEGRAEYAEGQVRSRVATKK